MNDSSKPAKDDPAANQLREASAAYGLDLPVAPAWFSDEPKGSWQDGYELSLVVLLDALKQPEIWEARDREMVAVEFVWQ